MSSCGGSVRSFHDDDEDTLLNERLDNHDADYDVEKGGTLDITSPSQHSLITYCTTRLRLSLILRTVIHSLLNLLPLSLWSIYHRKPNCYHGQLSTTAYLDGMRGLAAFAVFLCHLSYSTFDINHVYGAQTPGKIGENRNMLRLPIIRLIYSGPPMVSIFFVISGYALSYKPIKQMRSGDFEGLIKTLTSSVFRRPLRLFSPCLASTLIIVSMTRLGMYRMTEGFANDLRAVHEHHYWTAPTFRAQLVDWIHEIFNTVNVFDWGLYAGATNIDPHLWTIPVELRCSLALFVTHLLVARMSSRLRMMTLVFLTIWGTYWGRWEMAPFWAGSILAELELIKLSRAQMTLLNNHHECAILHTRWWTILHSTLFIVGLFLASYPDIDGDLSPGYVWLTGLIPRFYTEKHRFWSNAGSILIVYSIGNLQHIRQIFNFNSMQYLGKISFPLYVCHGFVIHTFTYASLDRAWRGINAQEDWPSYVKGFVVVAICTVALTIWVSDVFLRIIDLRCVKFARWAESKMFSCL